MAIQSDETLVTKGDLKTLYTDKILPYLGGNFMLGTNVSDYYSEDEKIVGVWTDGKPLYEKTLVGDLPTGSTGDNTVIWQNFTANGYEFHGGEGTLNWTSGRVAVPWSGGESNKACLNIYQGNLVIYWAASHFAGGTYIITVKYTKTTDTASSALTTPGCYDINRPDLWPENKEIFFGNGLYGYRTTGSMNMTKQTHNNVNCNVTATKFISQGGNWGANTGYEYPFGSTWNGNGSSSIAWINHSNSNTINLAFWPDMNLTNSAYDVWVTYIK